MKEPEAPFTNLGNHLKYVREQAKESLAEASGAVEIDQHYLEQIEAGKIRPSEDILLLLISHFGVKDHEAMQLWESAEYDSDLPDDIKTDHIQLTGKPLILLVAPDNRSVYTDGIEIVATQAGVTLGFTQGRKGGKQVPVARVGMSVQLADQLIRQLHRALLESQNPPGHKLLPPSLDS